MNLTLINNRINEQKSKLKKADQDIEAARAALMQDPTEDNARRLQDATAKKNAVILAYQTAQVMQAEAIKREKSELNAQDITRLKELTAKADKQKDTALKTLERLLKELATLQEISDEYKSVNGAASGGLEHKGVFKYFFALLHDLETWSHTFRGYQVNKTAKTQTNKLTQLQKDVIAMRYPDRDPRAPEVEVKLKENDPGTGEPVYRVIKR